MPKRCLNHEPIAGFGHYNATIVTMSANVAKKQRVAAEECAAASSTPSRRVAQPRARAGRARARDRPDRVASPKLFRANSRIARRQARISTWLRISRPWCTIRRGLDRPPLKITQLEDLSVRELHCLPLNSRWLQITRRVR